MNEWGIPDWCDPAAYGDVSRWTFNRWRWEFYRRRGDLRAAFDEGAEATFQHRQRYAGKPGFPSAHLRPDQPGFCAIVTVKGREKFGYSGLPNPRIGNRPAWAISLHPPEDSTVTHVSEYAPEGFERIDFDLSRPLEPQLRMAHSNLRELQKMEFGRVIQKRRHPTKWLAYLRTLDAREAMPDASWQRFTETLFNAGLLERHKDPAGGYRAPPPQAGRDKWEAANVLRSNF